MYPLAIGLILGLFLAFVYRKLRHESIFPKAAVENPYGAWLKITVAISVPVSILWIFAHALQSFPD